MKITLDGNAELMSCEQTDSVSSVVEEIKTYLTSIGKVFAGITLDGTEITIDSLPTSQAADHQDLAITTEIGGDMPTKMMVEVQESLGRLKQAMMDTANKIQQGSIEEAMGLFAVVLDGWDTIHQAIITISKFKNIKLEEVQVDGETGVAILSHPTDFIREMQEAMTTKDYITVADILEFEIAPLFPRFEKLLAEIATQV